LDYNKEKVLSDINDWIKFSDTKASALIAYHSVVLLFIIEKYNVFNSTINLQCPSMSVIKLFTGCFSNLLRATIIQLQIKKAKLTT